jgi:hypothetical protein
MGAGNSLSKLVDFVPRLVSNRDAIGGVVNNQDDMRVSSIGRFR